MNMPEVDAAASPVARMLKTLNKANPIGVASPAAQGRIKVRPGRPENQLPAWLQLQNRAFGRMSQRGWQEADFERELQSRPWYSKSKSFLATDRSTLVGGITLEFTENEPLLGRLHWLAVDPNYQRRGVGRLLVTACERECEERGLDRIEIETLRTWRAAMRFYASLGFQSR